LFGGGGQFLQTTHQVVFEPLNPQSQILGSASKGAAHFHLDALLSPF
jgi:hypothetical protein